MGVAGETENLGVLAKQVVRLYHLAYVFSPPKYPTVS